ncbi:MAG: hypothetical protein OXF79_20730 [Chloroflexi bacterium]|nr:hypothetical protein [Chloroflexota bacterium]
MSSSKRPIKAPSVRHNGRRQLFPFRAGYAPVVLVWFLCALLLVAAFACSSNDAVAPPQSETPADSVDVTLPRHHEPPVVNSGDDYVFGEIIRSGQCLRITYYDQTSPEVSREGLLVVWPPGFGAVVLDDAAQVLDPDDQVRASVGDTVRLSGRKMRQDTGEAPEWDWDGEHVADCPGPYWLVGDEVSAGVLRYPSDADDSAIFFPRMAHQHGPIVSMAALLEGRLELHGECLRVVTPREMQEFVIVWPPGFRVEAQDGELAVVNGGGSVIVRVGGAVAMGGGQPPRKMFPESSRCPGKIWNAMSVRSVP